MKRILIVTLFITAFCIGAVQAEVKLSEQGQAFYETLNPQEKQIFMMGCHNAQRVKELEEYIEAQKVFNAQLVELLDQYAKQIDANSLQFHNKYNF